MNADKLRRLQAQVRIGGKGTPRRKKKVMHQSAATDDKKLQSSLKKLSVSTIPGIEEVNIIKDDLTVIHFNNPKAQASLSANTFAVTGHGETKKIVEMLPEILPQLGQDTVMQLRTFANTMSGGQKQNNAVSTALDNVAEEDDVPLLVSDFEEVAKMEEVKTSKSKTDVKKFDEVPKRTENAISKQETTGQKVENVDKKPKMQQNKHQQQKENGAVKIKSDVNKNENKQQKQTKTEKANKPEKTQTVAENTASSEDSRAVCKDEVKLIKKADIKTEISKDKQEIEIKGPTETKNVQLTAKADSKEAQKFNTEGAENISAQQCPIEKPLKQTDQLVAKKKEGNKNKDRKAPEDITKKEKAKESNEEQTAELKPQQDGKKEETEKNKEPKNLLKGKKAENNKKEFDVQTKDNLKQQNAPKKEQGHDSKATSDKNKTSMQKSENKIPDQKILPGNIAESENKSVKKDDITEKKIVSTINNLNKDVDYKAENNKEIKQTNFVAEASNVPVSVEADLIPKNQNKELTQEALIKREESKESILQNLAPVKEIMEDMKEQNKALQKPITQANVVQSQPQPITPADDKEIKSSPSSMSKEEIVAPTEQLNKQPLTKIADSKKSTNSIQASSNNKKEESKGKSSVQSGQQITPAKTKPTPQGKPQPSARGPDKGTMPAKPGTPTEAASPQLRTPTTPNKKPSPSTTITPPIEGNAAITVLPTDVKVSSDAQKKPSTTSKQAPNKNNQQKSMNANVIADNKKTSAAKPSPPSNAKLSPQKSTQQEVKKHVSLPSAENTKQSQAPNASNTPQQQPSKQSSPSKQPTSAKQSSPTKQSSAKQTTTSQSVTQQPKASTTQSSQQQVINEPNGSSQIKATVPQGDDRKPETTSPSTTQMPKSSPQTGVSQSKTAASTHC